jgi:hypothetical protein
MAGFRHFQAARTEMVGKLGLRSVRNAGQADIAPSWAQYFARPASFLNSNNKLSQP